MSLNGEQVAIGRCYGCGRQFGFRPQLVPSYTLDGKRYPVCAECVERLNEQRRATGQPQFVIDAGAYDVEASVVATVVFPTGC